MRQIERGPTHLSDWTVEAKSIFNPICMKYVWCMVYEKWQKQLVYHSCTVVQPVVMAIYGFHWKWWSLTPCQRHPSEPIENKFRTIDYVIDLNNLVKFGSGKIFRYWGTYTQHIRVCAFFFFSFFYALEHGYSLNGCTGYNAQYLKRRRLVRGGAFSITEQLKVSISNVFFSKMKYN